MSRAVLQLVRRVHMELRRAKRWIGLEITGWSGPDDELLLVRAGDLRAIATDVYWIQAGVEHSTKTSANVKRIIRAKTGRILRTLEAL